MAVTVETKQYDFLDKSIINQKSIIYRLDVNGKRFYYEWVDDKPVIYSSGTTIISDGFPDPSKGLEEWRVKMRVMGKDPDDYARYRANYGTIMHILFGHLLMRKPIDLVHLDKYILELKDTGISDDDRKTLVENNLNEFKKDLLSFAQWVKDYKVKPIAIELMLASREYKVATAVDYICQLTIKEKGFFGETYKSGAKKGQQKESAREREVVAIIDFKSGKKGFYDKHALQLLLNKIIVEENYGEKLKVEKLFNFSPKEWKSTPSYNFKDQTNNRILEELDDILSIGMKRHARKQPMVVDYKGVLNFKNPENFNYKDNIVYVPLDEYIINNYSDLKETNGKKH